MGYFVGEFNFGRHMMENEPILPREAVCQYMGWDYEEASSHRYQYGRTTIPVYSTATGYVCAVANGKKPPKEEGYEWVEATGSEAAYCKSRGKTIWVLNTNEYL